MELKLDTNKEYGLVLEGGGAKGLTRSVHGKR